MVEELQSSTCCTILLYLTQEGCHNLRLLNSSLHVETFYYQLMHIMLKNTELLKHSKITLQHVSVYIETIFRELQSVLG